VGRGGSWVTIQRIKNNDDRRVVKGAAVESWAASRYDILERLGGDVGNDVHKARDLQAGRLVALKIFPGSSGDLSRLAREAGLASLLDHPRICQIYDFGQATDDRLFLAMELCEGEPLSARIVRGALKLETAIDLAAQIAAGLASAHEQGICHGRLGPSKVMVTSEDGAKVLGFGLSYLQDRTLSVLQEPPVGDDAYRAPEQLSGEAADPRTDLWALGALLYEMVAGQPPFPREDRAAALRSSPPPLSTRRQGVGAGLEQIVTRALAHRPENRYATAGELRSDLLQAGGGGARLIPVMRRDPLLGQTLGRYRILASIGSGGMGVVYKAEDLRLGRTVALKLLPPQLMSDPVANSRFLQEARAASLLDHPNICTVYDIGEASDGKVYLTMPCYGGETLRERIERGPLPLSEALDFTLQAARGLAKAHRHGIVHRDIKPANLMVTDDSVVKILDFGIAKLTGETGLTRPGIVIGTPAYMSPEQVRGETSDARSDLWALGVVFYEMVAGRHPFPGDHEAVRYSILSAEPKPLTLSGLDAPERLNPILLKLLAKDPASRYPTADALLTDLRLLAGISASSTPAPETVPGPPPRTVRFRRPAALLLVAGGAAAGLIALFLGLHPIGLAGGAPRPARVTQLTDQEGLEQFPSLAPDGNFFVYAKLDGGDSDIFLQRVGGQNPIDLTPDSPANDTQPAYSPQGDSIAFRSDRDGGGLFLMGATGGSVRRLTDFGYQPAWSPDGRDIAFATEPVTSPVARGTRSKIWSVEVQTGKLRRLSDVDAVQPSWSPHGWRIAYWGLTGSSPRRGLWTLPAAGGAPVRIIDDQFQNWNPVWAPDGRHLYFASDRAGSMNIWRVPIDEESGRVLGEPEPVLTPAQSVGPFALSKDGRRILYGTNDGKANVERVALDPAVGKVAGTPHTITQTVRTVHELDTSPDGEWIAFDAESPPDLFVMRADGSGLRQLTDDPYRDRRPRWSPDGRWIYFFSDRGGKYGLWALRPDGSGLHRTAVSQPDGDLLSPVPAPDGRTLACGLGFLGGPALVDLSQTLVPPAPVALNVRGGSEGVFFPRSWSPDGKFLAGHFSRGDALPDAGIGLYSFASHSYVVLSDHGDWPTFLHNGGPLLYLDGGAIQALDLRTRRSWLVLSPPENSSFRHFTVSPDGRTLYLVRATNEGDIWIQDLPVP
jgi:serine/threonine protein kinase/Tol biopolymer transport system component